MLTKRPVLRSTVTFFLLFKLFLPIFIAFISKNCFLLFADQPVHIASYMIHGLFHGNVTQKWLDKFSVSAEEVIRPLEDVVNKHCVKYDLRVLLPIRDIRQSESDYDAGKCSRISLGR